MVPLGKDQIQIESNTRDRKKYFLTLNGERNWTITTTRKFRDRVLGQSTKATTPIEILKRVPNTGSRFRNVLEIARYDMQGILPGPTQLMERLIQIIEQIDGLGFKSKVIVGVGKDMAGYYAIGLIASEQTERTWMVVLLEADHVLTEEVEVLL